MANFGRLFKGDSSTDVVYDLAGESVEIASIDYRECSRLGLNTGDRVDLHLEDGGKIEAFIVWFRDDAQKVACRARIV